MALKMVICVTERFKSFANRLGLSDEVATHLWQEIEAHYTQSHRYYHTLDHIKAMLGHFDQVKELLDDPDLVEAAIWYHDIIYKTQATHPDQSFDNEKESADLACNRLKNTSLDLKKLHSMILLTKHGAESPKTQDEAFLVDIDLSILGRPVHIYNGYAQLVRQEYSFVPKSLYKAGRSSILKEFLSQERIYKTDYFFNRFETSARSNIKNEICRLERPALTPK